MYRIEHLHCPISRRQVYAVLISSFHPSPTTRFEGHCFIASDYIAGGVGAAHYESSTGRTISPGHDGCYTVAIQRSYGWEIGTDSHGMARLYVYQEGDVWAAASSLYILAQHLRASGVSLNPSEPNLRALHVPGGLTQQPLSRHSILEGITLVPSHERLQVTASGIRAVSSKLGSEVTYEEALTDYVRTWQSRIQTIVDSEDSTLTADLSGGLDSRTVFAFLVSADISSIGPGRFKLLSNPKRAEDFAAAEVVAKAFGFTLNTPQIPRRSALSPTNAVNAWKETCLGVYLPVYLAPNDFEPLAFKAHGAGGETYREYFAEGRGPGDLGRLKSHFRSGEVEALQAQVDAERKALEQSHPHIPVNVSHYRQFRNRMHFGHRPHRRPMFTPLNSVLLDRVCDRPSTATDRQVYFDIMENLAPGLKDLPFDDPRKSPSDVINKNLTRVNSGTPLRGGGIFAEALPEEVRDPSGKGAFKLWIEEAAEAVLNPSVRAFLGTPAVTQAEDGMAEFRSIKKPLGANHRGAQSLSYALAVKFAFDF